MQALNFHDDVLKWATTAPPHLAISEGRPLLRGLGVFHGKRGWGVSVGVRRGPRPGHGFRHQPGTPGDLRFVVSEGTVRSGPLLQIGNTTSRVDFACDPGVWCDAWSAQSAHHWALGTGHRSAELAALAELLEIEMVWSLPRGADGPSPS